MIRLEKINKCYNTKKEKVHALKDINLELPNSGLITILGDSGSGKTTLLNIIGCLDGNYEGNMYYNDTCITSLSSNAISKHIYDNIGFTFQNYNLIEGLTVLENIMLPLELSITYEHSGLEELFNIFELDGLHNRKISELSGGQKQRVAIIRSLVKNPDTILCDEPTGNLDIYTSELVISALKHISSQKLVILVTHNRKIAYENSVRIIEIKDGTIIEDIVPQEKHNITNYEKSISYKDKGNDVRISSKEQYKTQSTEELNHISWSYFKNISISNTRSMFVKTLSLSSLISIFLSLFVIVNMLSTYNTFADYQKIISDSNYLTNQIILNTEVYDVEKGITSYKQFDSGNYVQYIVDNELNTNKIL